MIRAGLIGAGGISSVHARAYQSLANAQLVAVADIDHAAADRLAAEYAVKAYYSIDALLADPNVDMVDICVPTFAHEEAVIHAAAASKHVLCEKPIARTPSEVDRMIDAVERTGVCAMVAQVVRFWPQYAVIRDYLQQGQIGRPLTAAATRMVPVPAGSGWFSNPELSGGGMLDLHIHDLDFIYQLFGRPRNVYATGLLSASGAWDQILTTLDYGDHKAWAEASFFVPRGYPFTQTFRLLGSQGCLEFGLHQAGPSADAESGLVGYFPGEAPKYLPVEDKDPYLSEIEYFVDCLAGCRIPAIASLREARTVLEIAMAARRSLETGEVVHLNGQ